MALRILYLNAWGGRLQVPLMRYLPSIDADVYCLQEVMSTPQMALDALLAEKDTEYFARVNLFSNIQTALPDHHGFFFPFCCGFINDSQGTVEPVQYGIAMFVRKTLPIIETHLEFIFDSFRTKPDPVRRPMPRNAHIVRLWHPELECEYVIGHMHGVWQRIGKHDTKDREEQAGRLLAFLKSSFIGGEKVVFGGDFNLLPQSNLFPHLALLGLHEQVTRYGYRDTRTSFYAADKPHRYADYLLTSRSVEIESFEVSAEPEVSDHRPLVLVCR
jgi:endonuclease/exonuclease/phosphatase family metal-dependent hydrolase